MADTVSRTELEIERLTQRLAELQALKAAEEAARATATAAVRLVAITMHSRFCKLDHPSLACTWYTDPAADEPNAANWTEPEHARRLLTARSVVGLLRQLGWTVSEPTP